MIKSHIFILILSFITLGCTTSIRQTLPGNAVLISKEKSLLERAEKEQALLAESGQLYEDQDLEIYLNSVVKKLLLPTIQSQTAPTVKVIKDPHLNAFVFPNGVIYIHTGILARLDNEAQLAALLAHEVIHIMNRHAFKAFDRFKNSQFGQGSRNQLGDFLNRLGTSLSIVVMAGYSQAQETEADLEGMALVANAGYDPREAIRLFEHLKREVETEKIKEFLFFGIHPRIDKRIENCETFIKKRWQTGKKGLLYRGTFLKKTREVVLVNAFLDFKAGRYESARRGAEKYLDLRKDDARVYYLMGEISRHNGKAVDMEKIMDFYEKAIAINPMYPEPYKAIGLIHYKGEAWGLAKQAFESYLFLSSHILDKDYILGYLRKCDINSITVL